MAFFNIVFIDKRNEHDIKESLNMYTIFKAKFFNSE